MVIDFDDSIGCDEEEKKFACVCLPSTIKDEDIFLNAPSTRLARFRTLTADGKGMSIDQPQVQVTE